MNVSVTDSFEMESLGDEFDAFLEQYPDYEGAVSESILDIERKAFGALAKGAKVRDTAQSRLDVLNGLISKCLELAPLSHDLQEKFIQALVSLKPRFEQQLSELNRLLAAPPKESLYSQYPAEDFDDEIDGLEDDGGRPPHADASSRAERPQQVDASSQSSAPSQADASSQSEFAPPATDFAASDSPSHVDTSSQSVAMSQVDASSQSDSPSQADASSEAPRPDGAPAQASGPSQMDAHSQADGPAQLDASSQIEPPSRTRGPPNADRPPQADAGSQADALLQADAASQAGGDAPPAEGGE